MVHPPDDFEEELAPVRRDAVLHERERRGQAARQRHLEERCGLFVPAGFGGCIRRDKPAGEKQEEQAGAQHVPNSLGGKQKGPWSKPRRGIVHCPWKNTR